MRIIVDVNHPANVHYFKHFINEMRLNGHEVLVTASEKEVSYQLLESLGIPYVGLGNYGDGILRKAIGILLHDWRVIRLAHKFRPDLFIGHGSIRAAHASAILGVPCIITSDTEHVWFDKWICRPFTDNVLVPSCYRKELGKKTVRFPGYMELLYLHPNRFEPNPDVLAEIGLEEGSPFIVMRFVSWEAAHDLKQSGIKDKVRLVRSLEKLCPVFISSESELPSKLERNRLLIGPERLHDLLYYASLYVGEGATTASESAVLGTPAIYANTLTAGTLEEQEKKYGLLHHLIDEDQIIDKAKEFILDSRSNQRNQSLRRKMLSDKIDVTSFLVQFVENLEIRK